MSFSTTSSLSERSRRRCSSGGSIASSPSPETVPALSFELSLLREESERSDLTFSESERTDFTPIPIVQSHNQQYQTRQQRQQQQHCVESQSSFRDGEEAYDGNYVFACDTPIKPSATKAKAAATRTISIGSSRNKSNNFSFMTCMSACGVLFMCAVFFLGATRVSDHTSAAKLREVEAARHELEKNQERLLLQLAKDRHLPMDENITDLVQHVTLLQQELEQAAASLQEEISRREEVEREAEEAWSHYEEATSQLSDTEMQMQQDVGRLYQTLAEDHFGPGPYYVEFEVRIWQSEKQEAETRYFTVETSPMEQMPASVFTFLQQVVNRLWDGSSFYINAPHILLAQPLSFSHHHQHHDVVVDHDEEEKELPFQKMERMGMARVPFAEYNNEYAHKPYTLGYGVGEKKLPGPNFYINKVDNTDHHEGEPRFANVIIGHDTIDLMGQLTGHDDHAASNPYYIHPVDIVRVQLIHDLAEAHGGQEYLNLIHGHDEH